jgi:hypothetical protein
MRCGGSQLFGSVQITGELNLCPRIEWLIATPLEGEPQRYALRASGSDEDGLPEPLAFTWTTSSGSVLVHQPSSVAFTCGPKAQATIVLVVDDGDSACTPARAALAVACDQDAGSPAEEDDAGNHAD